jgi:hypothetical protein
MTFLPPSLSKITKNKIKQGDLLLKFYDKEYTPNNQNGYEFVFTPKNYHPIYDYCWKKELKIPKYGKFHIMATKKKDQKKNSNYTEYYIHITVGHVSYGQGTDGETFRTNAHGSHSYPENDERIARELYYQFRDHMKTAKKDNQTYGLDEQRKDRERRFGKIQGGKTRKHRGIIQTGGNKGRLRKGYRYSGKRLKSGLPQIIKCKKR